MKTWALDSDPRYWMPQEKVTIKQTVTLPAGVSGNVTLYLNLPDPCENLHDNPLFSIRLANKDANDNDVWEESTGYNRLHSFSL